MSPFFSIMICFLLYKLGFVRPQAECPYTANYLRVDAPTFSYLEGIYVKEESGTIYGDNVAEDTCGLVGNGDSSSHGTYAYIRPGNPTLVLWQWGCGPSDSNYGGLYISETICERSAPDAKAHGYLAQYWSPNEYCLECRWSDMDSGVTSDNNTQYVWTNTTDNSTFVLLICSSSDPGICDTYSPTYSPTLAPTTPPTMNPSSSPSQPSLPPSSAPSFSPTLHPSSSPSQSSMAPSFAPSISPTFSPSFSPSQYPSSVPSQSSMAPSLTPSASPSQPPSIAPSTIPSLSPSLTPSLSPSISPSLSPSLIPSYAPSMAPSNAPSLDPSIEPSVAPSFAPSNVPSIAPSNIPSVAPSLVPTLNPTITPSIVPSMAPSHSPSSAPSQPTDFPSLAPTLVPSLSPSITPTFNPAINDTEKNTDEYCFDVEFFVDYEEFEIEFIFYCTNSTVRLNFLNTDYNDNWFGIVFAHEMNGNAVIFTTGKSSSTRTEALYAYLIISRSLSGVHYSSINDWKEIQHTISDTNASLSYWKYLNVTDWDMNTTEIKLRIAWHSDSLVLTKHSEISTKLTLGVDGSSTSVEDDKTLIMIHAVCMWIAWSVLCTFGIMSSAFRYLYKNDSMWFKMHRFMQFSTTILALIAFILAVIYISINNYQHFVNFHTVFGLVVIIFAVLQPINGIFRPHSPNPSATKSETSFIRKLWETIHKFLGYFTWVLAQIVILYGLVLINNGNITGWIYAQIAWMSFIAVVYLSLQWHRFKNDDTSTRGRGSRTTSGNVSVIEALGIEIGKIEQKNTGNEGEEGEECILEEEGEMMPLGEENEESENILGGKTATLL